MDGDASSAGHQQVIDWLEQAPDLPHLIARVSELVHRLGYAPEELVVLPRAELDRRELAAYRAGWADVVEERLPPVRRAYEERITAAYLQGHSDARTGLRPRRARRPEAEVRRPEAEEGGEVISLPYVQLLNPPSELTRMEEHGERERTLIDEARVPSPRAPAAKDRPLSAGAGDAAAPDILLSAREMREKKAASARRRSVVRRKGRASVPPLPRPAENGAARRDEGRSGESAGQPPPSQQEPPPPARAGGEQRPLLSDKARALADDLEGRASGRRRDDHRPGAPG
ncbi:hypothetical protein ABZZ79_25030 [Streptomyces sp. NPDC006458]|uniref:hypothetical protein n=1 Tax=Streptomyces sp. NPDC006458 TaxID=3154302 RepID=UPI0033B65910